jgi:hypothetical protein
MVRQFVELTAYSVVGKPTALGMDRRQVAQSFHHSGRRDPAR